MNTDSSVITEIAVTMLPKLNSFLFLPLFERCGGIESFFNERPSALNTLYKEFNIPIDAFDRQSAISKAEQELTKMDRLGIRVCSFEHADYPTRLKQCNDTPLVFFYKGRILQYEPEKCLAIVGTRKASDHCKKQVEQIVQGLSSSKTPTVIVSGLAFGIDITAHNASLKYGLTTYAVLGHGLHTIYPAAHKQIADKIIAEGGTLISEFPTCAPILPINFLQRNRIIAGLCDATILAESAVKGGGMATARMAVSYNRDVMTIPGRPEDKMAAGCNLLIKENLAALVENAEDVARILNIQFKEQPGQQITLNLFPEEDNEKTVVRILTEKNAVNIDELSIYSEISINELAALLMKMELEGTISSLPGKKYMLN